MDVPALKWFKTDSCVSTFLKEYLKKKIDQRQYRFKGKIPHFGLVNINGSDCISNPLIFTIWTKILDNSY